jgi:hypothetical protein
MSFQLADVKALLLAALALSLFGAAKAQTPQAPRPQPNGGGQSIVFSSPDGQTISNAPIPMAEAPEPQETPDLPSQNVSVPHFSGPPTPWFALPQAAMQQQNAENRDNLQDPMDLRKQLGGLTPAQIMKVPSPEEIFGLAQKPADTQKKPWQTDNNFGNGPTNTPAPDISAIFAEPSWAKTWTGDMKKKPGYLESSNSTEKTSGLLGGFFDTARNDTVFGSHDAGSQDTLGAPSQPGAQQSPWDSDFTSSSFATPISSDDAAPTKFSMPSATTSSAGLGSQPPFAVPRVSSLDTLPKLPALPSATRQDDQLVQPTTSASSWGPKPPPWTQSQTPFGTPVQFKIQ